jgi:nitronate monooxygenase
MGLPHLQIGNLVAKYPIIQGGMGVGVSLSGLASAVANCGGIGVISCAQIGFREENFELNARDANINAIRKEIRKARKLSPKGVLGVNIMVAMQNYEEMVRTSIEEGIDIIISGAGLPLSLPKLVENSNTKIAPIVSSGKAANIILKLWLKRYNKIPDFVVVEGPEAGGHLGFSVDQLSQKLQLSDIVKEVIETVRPYEEEYNVKIPVIAAGGIYTGQDIAKFLNIGAAGVQMATRFVATNECDAHINFKMAYLNSKKEDIIIVKSPVGMPGRAIRNKFINKTFEGRIAPTKCYYCIKKCDVKTTPYCITCALIEAVEGNTDEGLVFTGSSAYRLNKIVSVRELMNELVEDAEKAYIK